MTSNRHSRMVETDVNGASLHLQMEMLQMQKLEEASNNADLALLNPFP